MVRDEGYGSNQVMWEVCGEVRVPSRVRAERRGVVAGVGERLRQEGRGDGGRRGLS